MQISLFTTISKNIQNYEYFEFLLDYLEISLFDTSNVFEISLMFPAIVRTMYDAKVEMENGKYTSLLILLKRKYNKKQINRYLCS